MADVNFGHSYSTSRVNLIFKMRQIFSQINGVFSEFSKHIAPAYHHDRCESSVQMRLYTMHKREFLMVFIVFFALLGLAVFIGLAGPSITVTVEQQAKQLQPSMNASQFSTGPFVLISPPMSPYAQQLWLITQLIVSVKGEETFSKEFYLSANIEGVTINNKSNTQIPLSIHLGNKSRSLQCSHHTCDDVTVLHLSHLHHPRYHITIEFLGLAELQQWYNLNDVIFYYKTYNPAFTKLEIWCRCIFIVTSFSVACWLAHCLRNYAIYDWSLEQKWVSALLPLLLLYNDPFFPATFLMDSMFPAFVDVVFQATFICGILLFWLSFYHGLRQNERKFSTFYLPKVSIVGLLWISVIVMDTLQTYNESADPMFSESVSTNHFQNFKIFFCIVGGVYVLYLTYFVVTAYSELRSMPYFDLRLRFCTVLMVSLTAISICIFSLQFGLGTMEDNFVAQLHTQSSSSAQFMAFYGMLNLYVSTMAYVYAPTDHALSETHLVKDNPAFSMANDSDEDVVYGSDDDSRRPLNRGSNENDESD